MWSFIPDKVQVKCLCDFNSMLRPTGQQQSHLLMTWLEGIVQFESSKVKFVAIISHNNCYLIDWGSQTSTRPVLWPHCTAVWKQHNQICSHNFTALTTSEIWSTPFFFFFFCWVHAHINGWTNSTTDQPSDWLYEKGLQVSSSGTAPHVSTLGLPDNHMWSWPNLPGLPLPYFPMIL